MDIIEARERKGWSRKELSERSGISYSLLSNMENGYQRCTERTGTAIALALDVRPRDLTLPGGRSPSGSVEWNCECVSLETIPDPPSTNGVLQEVYQADLREAIRTLLHTLTYRERRILSMRFGLDGNPHTLEETGKLCGVSRERIRQIEAQALGRLRHPLRARKVRDYYV